ncbi:hypothetical protein SAMN05216474_1242 [Lishizhenia tianjinensis]|uniref:Uncharacterized protein n=1 Tax=Lishizhenia tianjinensis TaxID=477690 RepID=A0A1I6YWA7_9FLAO|nr:hypothetical protein [Lishizhenia tianjinensis]SFT54820.1 hypothetical protein SAMN05216474_1242 [Lishizhenia tianjinensis]
MALKIDTQKLNTVSPKDTLTFLSKIRLGIFGKQKPDGFTRIVFFLNVLGFFIFICWAAISYVAIALNDLIQKSKQISVEEIVIKRGEELGFEKGEVFLENFKQFQFLDIFIWLALFCGLVFLYRKKSIYALFYFGAFILHFLLMFYLLGMDYIFQDISMFDKIAYAVMLLPTLLYFFLLKKEKTDEINYDE